MACHVVKISQALLSYIESLNRIYGFEKIHWCLIQTLLTTDAMALPPTVHNYAPVILCIYYSYLKH